MPRAHKLSVPDSVDATGTFDMTAKLQRFLASVPDDSVVEFPAGARYQVNGTLTLKNPQHLTIEGNRAVIVATSRGDAARSQWRIENGADVIFRDLVVHGANPHGGVGKAAYVRKLETQHGFQLEGVQGFELDRVTVTDTFGDFVYVGRDSHKVSSTNVWIHDSTFARDGRQGIAVTSASGVIIERNSFTDTRRSTIDLEPNARSWLVSGVFVLDNVVGKGRLLFVASHGRGPVDDVVISGNRLEGHSLTVDTVAAENKRRSNWIVTDNVSDTTVRSRPMRFTGIDGLVVRGNRQPVAGGQPAAALTDVCGAQVDGNDFGGAAVRSSGRKCAAKLSIPQPPAIAGRPASQIALPGPGHQSHTRTVVLWIVGIVAVLSGVVVLVLALRRRRRRRRRSTASEESP